MDDLIVEFLAETNESLTELDKDLVLLEQNPNDDKLLSKIFRVMHTIKGTCGFLGLGRLEKVAHAGENILGKFRDKEIIVNTLAVTLVLETLDTIKIIVESLETTGAEPDGDDTSLKQRIADFISSGGQEPSSIQVTAPAIYWCGEEEDKIAESLSEEFMQVHKKEDVSVVTALIPEPEKAAVIAAIPTIAVAQSESASGNQSIRVSVDLLEDLMTIVSELVLTRNQLLQILRGQQNSAFANALQRLNFNVSELQEGVMKTRMQPIGNAWQKLPRIVRDLTNELHKDIDLVMSGEETELDRQVLELIKDPLTHMVRNSADHGIETPEERIKAGKNGKGHIWLSAYHEGGHIIIQIKDDGKGLNTARIKEKAIQNKLMTSDEADRATPKQLHMLIFAAGFSTAAAVTAVSGRGVGMDVVRSNIEKIGGTVDLVSEEGKGTMFTIKIPLTLAIVSALIVESSGERYAIPQISVLELVRGSDKGENRIENIQGTPVLRLRNRLLPLVSLEKVLQLDKIEHRGDNVVSLDSVRKQKTSHPFIIVTQVGNYTFGIIVDQVFDTEEIVVKPVSPILRHIEMFSGNTILGDGTVIMILDPNGIAKASGQANAGENIAAMNEEAEAETARVEKNTLLLFRAGGGAPKAVPLAMVGRLEEFQAKNIEVSDNQFVIQYRGELMPLVPFDEKMLLKQEGTQAAIVFLEQGRHMGLLVDEIIDIVEEELHMMSGHGTPGVMGSAIINQKATDVIDVGYYVERGHGDWFGTVRDSHIDKSANRVLLVDDSAFFRNMLGPLLEMSGYQVTTTDHPKKALALRDAGQMFDLIVSDIEMPEMNGFDFAQAVRDGGKWQDIPMLALTSHVTSEDIAHGKQVGFNDHLPKFDRETLLESIAQNLNKRQIKKGAVV